MHFHNDSFILPATQVLLGKLKCTAEEAALKMDSGSLLVCERDNGFGKKPTVIFLSDGAKSDFSLVGTRFNARHDQTHKPLGEHTIKGVLNYKVENGKFVVLSESALAGFEPRSISAALFVYK